MQPASNGLMSIAIQAFMRFSRITLGSEVVVAF